MVHCAPNYCSKNAEHLFCKVDCLRAPDLCSGHKQIDITKRHIADALSNLNYMREDAVNRKLIISVILKRSKSYKKRLDVAELINEIVRNSF